MRSTSLPGSESAMEFARRYSCRWEKSGSLHSLSDTPHRKTPERRSIYLRDTQARHPLLSTIQAISMLCQGQRPTEKSNHFFRSTAVSVSCDESDIQFNPFCEQACSRGTNNSHEILISHSNCPRYRRSGHKARA